MATLAGCAFNPFQQQSNPSNLVVKNPTVPSAPTSLTEQAAQTLKMAEVSVQDARQTHTLWSSALQHLGRAQLAAKLFDSQATMQHAQEVINICLRSAAQANSPRVSW